MNNKSKLEIDIYGNKRWKLLNGLFHREDGPAYETVDGIKYWCLYGKFHRVDGPAAIFPNGSKLWSLNDITYSYEDWFQQLTPEQQNDSLFNLDE